MSEWEVFLTIGVILGFIVTVAGPIIKLNTAIVKLISAVDALEKIVEDLTDRNDNSHHRMWQKLEEHAECIADHETRLSVLERGEK